MENTYALGHVTSVPKEQNLPMLFNEGENSQVTGSYFNQVKVDMRLDFRMLTFPTQYDKAVFGIFYGLLVLCSGSLL